MMYIQKLWIKKARANIVQNTFKRVEFCEIKFWPIIFFTFAAENFYCTI